MKPIGEMEEGMSLRYNPFQSKLRELDQEYRRMEKWIQICHVGTKKEVKAVKETLLQEFREDERQMEDMVDSGRSQVVSKLAAAQLEHYRSNAIALEHAAEYFKQIGKEEEADRAESMALYAEFAMDHAVHAVRYALLAVCSAVEMQMQIEEDEEEKMTQEDKNE